MVESRFESRNYLVFLSNHYYVYDIQVGKEVAGTDCSKLEVEKMVKAFNDSWDKHLAQVEAAELRKQYEDYIKTV